MTGSRNQLEHAIQRIVEELYDGLRHGFFEYRLTGEIVTGGKRQLILEVGKKFKFVISEEELRRSGSSGSADS